MYKRISPSLFIILMVITVLTSGCGISPEEAMVKGFALYDQGKHVDCQPYLEKALEGGIDDPELVVRAAFLRATINEDPSSAIEILMESALRYPTYARTYNQLGVVAYIHGPHEDGENLRQAIDFTLTANEYDDTDWKIMDNLGLYYGQLGVLDSAVIWLNFAKEIEPDQPQLNARLAELESFMEHKALLDSLASSDTLKLGI